MAFPVPITSVLTGATVAQLAYWRKDTRSSPALLVPENKRSGRYLYSWADVVALRSMVYLRSEKSLPKIRRARALMDKYGVETWLQVDGGVSLETIERCAEAGADVFVAGSAVYSAQDPDAMVAELRAKAEAARG